MVISDLSNRRPVLAIVLNLLLIVFGVIAYQSLPLREYPDIDSPVVSVRADYPGANAEIVEREVTQRIEDQIAGIEGIRYIQSSSQDGRANVTIEFNLNRDIDAAANDVREAVSRAARNLPDDVEAPVISKADADAQPIIWFNLTSDRLSGLELSDFADRFLVDRLSTVDGVALLRLGGSQRFAMRVWLDRQALAARGLTVADLEDALRRENIELPAGRLDSVEREFQVRVDRLYRSAADFAALPIRRDDNGHLIRLGEIADVELGADTTRTDFRGNGVDMIGIGVIRQSNANVLDVARGVKRAVEELSPSLPEGMTLVPTYDQSVFIEGAIREVYLTLAVATGAVVFVIWLFLGSVRATLIPAVTVPVAITASFIGVALFGFSVNLLTLLALVLAIGLVVDDAIVMLENIHRRMQKGEPPLLAAYRGARQVGFAIVATTSVLVAVFVPLAFLAGTTGRLFTEFAIAIAIAVVFSSIVALTLAPVLAARLLKVGEQEGRIGGAIQRGFARIESAYGNLLRQALKGSLALIPILLIAAAGVVWLLSQIPEEFAPFEDRGAFFVLATGPEGQSFESMREQMREVERRMMPLVAEDPNDGPIRRILVRTPGFGAGDSVNNGFVITILHHWDDREQSAQAVMAEVNRAIADMPGITARAIMRQGLSGGRVGAPIQVAILGPEYDQLLEWGNTMVAAASETEGLARVELDYRPTQPQVRVRVDRDRAADLGVSLRDIGRTLDVFLGGRAVTTFQQGGEEYDVILEGREGQRGTIDDAANLFVRARGGELVPLSNLVSFEEVAGAGSLERYNRSRAVTLSAQLDGTLTLGQAIDEIERLAADRLPAEARLDYKGDSLDFKSQSQQIYFIFGLALIIVFLVLAAQFESFVHPLVIMLTVPLAIVGALLGLWLTGQTLNIYSQIGIIMLIGLAAKNGILVVEFTNQLRDRGRAFEDAIVEASAQRLRPVLMTALTTVAGSIPLLLASGPGAETRYVLGVAIFSGVLVATLFTLFIVPAAYHLLARKTGSPQATAKRIGDLAGHISDVDDDPASRAPVQQRRQDEKIPTSGHSPIRSD
ncbi:MAG: efflux RND transporter permease subunit [Thioalkalivibrionaceae bacterium]